MASLSKLSWVEGTWPARLIPHRQRTTRRRIMKRRASLLWLRMSIPIQMNLLSTTMPPFDVEEWARKPFAERARMSVEAFGLNGAGQHVSGWHG